ncbi:MULTISPECIES: urea ABC transporter permease subunit UrtB [Pseudonocardia]|uniref:High-affinity branched-chain amino acid transport system permease protein LivH n=2 Tax=Pseudonocardia TaxID=1847 RepID=A0A1Y2MNW5_PSEAH|nr:MULTISPECIES: urea ABC transporter permease subunit UrtB [Pseudonocardia]OSY36935.1 High-affinity branched-chain amino acid transport system permease protein LivH [Pseudonocardia autotrophica]TDN75618.1 urea ABC transporter membrane protein [Pseudonocardia autotrophica]BBF99589.1 branched-chain amino acid ABC transporter permease [Pseudonocardia autotrophica]GEC28608.1 branched-chain amino acid ABC transporter permease [Pseudonocardia saturnea]
METLVTQVFNGLSVGSILLLAALGLSLTFGQMGVINMAHGEFIMAGAYTAFVVQQTLGAAGLSLVLSLPLAFGIGGLLGVVLELTLLRRMYHRPLDTLLVTWGVALVLQQLARDIFGTAGVDVAAPAWLAGPVQILGFSFPRSRLFILVLAVLAVTAVVMALRYTSLGRRIRATVQNRQLAESSGISTRRTDMLTFFIGSGLAGVAGVALTLMGSISPNLGSSYIVDAFLVVIVGGLGQLKGAIIAAFSLGVAQSWIEYTTTASIAKVLVLALVVAFLQFRPQGIFTLRTRSLV